MIEFKIIVVKNDKFKIRLFYFNIGFLVIKFIVFLFSFLFFG